MIEKEKKIRKSFTPPVNPKGRSLSNKNGHSNRFNKRVKERQDKFIEIYSKNAHAGNALREIGLTYGGLALWRDQPEFNARFEAARKAGSQIYEDTAKKRAVDGIEEDVYYNGQVVGKKKYYSDMLLKTMLQANDKRYCANTQLEVGNSDNSFSIVLQRATKPNDDSDTGSDKDSADK